MTRQRISYVGCVGTLHEREQRVSKKKGKQLRAEQQRIIYKVGMPLTRPSSDPTDAPRTGSLAVGVSIK